MVLIFILSVARHQLNQNLSLHFEPLPDLFNTVLDLHLGGFVLVDPRQMLMSSVLQSLQILILVDFVLSARHAIHLHEHLPLVFSKHMLQISELNEVITCSFAGQR